MKYIKKKSRLIKDLCYKGKCKKASILQSLKCIGGWT